MDSKIILKGGEIIIKSFKKKVYFNISPQKEIYIDDREGNYIKIDSEGRILEHGNNKAFFDSGDKSVGIQTLENNIVVTGICSPKLVLGIFDVFGPIFLFHDPILVYLAKLEKICCWNSISNNMKIFQLSTLGTWIDGATAMPYQVSEFCGIFENTLVCTLNSGGVLLLDIEKGEIKSFLEDSKILGGVFQKEPDSPIFVGLKHITFIEINAGTGELLRQVNIEEELKRIANIPNENPTWLTVGTSIYQDGLFYFYGETNFLGVFDHISEKIIEHNWFDFDKKKYQQLKGGKENLQVKDGKIYCLDTLGNLYELEQEVSIA